MSSDAAVWLARYGLKPKKSWGQNFLTDESAIARLAGACELNAADTLVVEIGAGTGALTERLVAPGREVLAIERDRELAEILRARFADTAGLTICEANALTFDWAHEAEIRGTRLKLIGNLPYHLTAPILFRLLRTRRHVRSAHLLVQKEVGLRISAPPDSDDYSLLSVLLGRVASCEIGVTIGRGSFLPAPRVDSRGVILRFHEVGDESPDFDELFIAFAKAAFHKRRKTLANSLAKQSFLPLPAAALGALKAEFPLWLAARAESLPVDHFVVMAQRLEQLGVKAGATQTLLEDELADSAD